MPRLVVVSNRTPDPQAARAGGLAIALRSALEETGGLWFGWNGQTTPDEAPRMCVRDAGPYVVASVPLPQQECDGYYNGFANQALWPLFHGRDDLAVFDRRHFAAYQRVNGLFARHLLGLLRGDDLVWIHDYHLIPLARCLRQAGAGAPLGFFLHIPFPGPDVLAALPWRTELIRDLCAYDLLGFQTEADAQNFRDAIIAYGQPAVSSRFHGGARGVRVGAFPIGIDAAGFAALAALPETRRRARRLLRHFGRRRNLIGVDRLDYTKGLVPRLKAYGRLLTETPCYRGNVTFTQIVAPSRETVPEYAALKGQLETLSARLKERFATPGWAPLRYLYRTLAQPDLAALYQVSRVGVVTPLRDGMNLVAKEYVAAQTAEDPGVLVLSRFAGAAAQLSGALLVDPGIVSEVAQALRWALDMPLEERQARWREMREEVHRRDVSYWRQSFLAQMLDMRCA